VGKRLDELRRTVRDGIGLISVESAGELAQLADIAAAAKQPVRIGIRVNPDVKTKTHPYTQTGEADKKFGVPLPQVVDLVRRALAIPFLRLESIGMHLGSQICDPQVYVTAGSRIADLVTEVRSLGVETLRAVDVGGGLGIRYTDETALEAEAFAAAVTPLARDTGLTLFVEPGRYLVGNAGVLLARCLYRKEAQAKAFVVLDAAMNDLLRPSLYGAEHDIQVVGADPTSQSGSRERVDVVGPVCETGDFLGRDRHLPAAQPGALLAILGVGAYGFSMSSTYNSRPRAAEVMIDGERWAIARRREALEDLMLGERTLDEIEAADAWRDTAAAEFETP
jgi:diaminopimelate decarboxylase